MDVMNKFKTLYVSDLDGTLLGDDSLLSPRTVEVLSRVLQRGALFTVATARTPATVVPLMSRVPLTLPMIVIGGAAWWNPTQQGYEHVRAIPVPTVDAIATAFEQHGLHPFIYRRHDQLLIAHHLGPMSHQETRFVAARQGLALKRFVLDDHDYRHSPDEALLMFAMNDYAKLQPIACQIEHTVHCTVTLYHDIFDPRDGYLEVYAAGTTKAAAIAQLATVLQADRVVVFGDNRNDLPMMQAATHSVAVGNATAQVQAIASEVIGPNTADSVAQWIERDLDRHASSGSR